MDARRNTTCMERQPTGTLSFVRPGGSRLPVLRTYVVTNANGIHDGAPVIAAVLKQTHLRPDHPFTTAGAREILEEAFALDGNRGFLTQLAPLFDRPIADFLCELCRFAPTGGTFVFGMAEATATGESGHPTGADA